ncbi:MAG: glutamate racemase [Pseudomonas sp.]
MNGAPIGVFDSGVGGLSVLGEIRARLPEESLLYVADSGHVPYGEKTPEFIRERSQLIAEFLLAQGAKALVLACNTATAAAVADLRQRYPELPIVGMEPAVKPAAAATRSGVVGVLATTGTLKSARFAALLDRFASDVRVITQPCPGLVEQIEAGELASPHTRELLQRWVEPLLAEGCDTLILGCTHYPFIKPLLRELLPASVSLVDTGAAVARQLQSLLDQRGLRAPLGEARQTRLWSSGDPQQLQRVLPQLWGEVLDVESLNDA